MAIYSVYVPQSVVSRRAVSKRAAFIEDKFSWAAFVIAPAWLLWNRLWLALAAYSGVAGVTFYVGTAYHLTDAAHSILFALMHLFVGFEGQRLVAYGLERRGFVLSDVVAGTQIDEVERRFFARWLSRLRADPKTGSEA